MYLFFGYFWGVRGLGRSEDNGATWTNVNTTLWENSLASDYVLNDIPYTGQRYRTNLHHLLPNNYPIVIDGLQHRGVYVVRVVTGSGDVRQGKIIVE